MASSGALPPRYQSTSLLRREDDPLAAVMSFGSKAVRIGLTVGITLAALSHGVFAGKALAAPVAMRDWTLGAQQQIHDFLWASYDVELVKPPPPPPPSATAPPTQAPEPAAAPAPEPRAVAKAADEPPPPAAAQAGQVLTAPSEPGAPVDLTGEGFLSGSGTGYSGGVTAASGTATSAVYDRNAVAGGTPGGTGSGAPRAVVPEGPDKSRPATPESLNWSCPFPPEADVDQVDYATVNVVVSTRPDGSARSVQVINDPGHGFGRAARMCALTQRFHPALDRTGEPTAGTTAPIRVSFTR